MISVRQPSNLGRYKNEIRALTSLHGNEYIEIDLGDDHHALISGLEFASIQRLHDYEWRYCEKINHVVSVETGDLLANLILNTDKIIQFKNSNSCDLRLRNMTIKKEPIKQNNLLDFTRKT